MSALINTVTPLIRHATTVITQAGVGGGITVRGILAIASIRIVTIMIKSGGMKNMVAIHIMNRMNSTSGMSIIRENTTGFLMPVLNITVNPDVLSMRYLHR